MQTQEFWECPTVRGFILSELPEYRLSKFQQALPDLFAIEMVKNYLLDIKSGLTFLNMMNIF